MQIKKIWCAVLVMVFSLAFSTLAFCAVVDTIDLYDIGDYQTIHSKLVSMDENNTSYKLYITGQGEMPGMYLLDMRPWNDYSSQIVEVVISYDYEAGITNIGDDAFYGCTNLKSITIPETVTTIGNNVFSGCTNLTDVKYYYFEWDTPLDLTTYGVPETASITKICVYGDYYICADIEQYATFDNDGVAEFDIKVNTEKFAGEGTKYLDSVSIFINDNKTMLKYCYVDDDGYLVFPVKLTVNNYSITSVNIRAGVYAKESSGADETTHFESVSRPISRA